MLISLSSVVSKNFLSLACSNVSKAKYAFQLSACFSSLFIPVIYKCVSASKLAFVPVKKILIYEPLKILNE